MAGEYDEFERQFNEKQPTEDGQVMVKLELTRQEAKEVEAALNVFVRPRFYQAGCMSLVALSDRVADKLREARS